MGRNREGILTRLMARRILPVFVKPANLGSSVGISKAKDRDGLAAAIDEAIHTTGRSWSKMLCLPPARSRSRCWATKRPKPRLPGEIIPSREFYDYEAKYLDHRSQLIIPAPLDEAQTAEVRRMAVEAFLAVDGAGMGRVDFLLDRNSGTWFVNEINTIPGFTTISMYPKLWNATGLGYGPLLERLIELALARHAATRHLRTGVA